MGRVIDLDSILIYKGAVERLKRCKMAYDKKKLIANPELCREIIDLMDYYDLL